MFPGSRPMHLLPEKTTIRTLGIWFGALRTVSPPDRHTHHQSSCYTCAWCGKGSSASCALGRCGPAVHPQSLSTAQPRDVRLCPTRNNQLYKATRLRLGRKGIPRTQMDSGATPPYPHDFHPSRIRRLSSYDVDLHEEYLSSRQRPLNCGCHLRSTQTHRT